MKKIAEVIYQALSFISIKNQNEKNSIKKSEKCRMPDEVLRKHCRLHENLVSF